VSSGIAELRRGLDPMVFAREAGLDPDSWQEDVLRSESKRLLLNCSRQSGKTTTVAALALWTAIYRPRSFCLIFSPSLDQSLEFFRRVADLAHGVGLDSVDPEALRKTGLDLKNGSRIEARPGSERTARGRTADLLVIDEASRVEDELYRTLRPMLAVTGGRMVMLSTPFGKRGVFEAWEHGEGWERYKVTAYECPRISSEFLEEERREMLDYVFRREYMCMFEELESAVFQAALIDEALANDEEPLWLD
jgi:hypothetical protein